MVRTEDGLRAQGWTRQNTIDEPRLSELVKMYEDLGLEVHLEPLHLEEEDRCDDCLKVDPDRFRTIYTRPRKNGNGAKGELDDLY